MEAASNFKPLRALSNDPAKTVGILTFEQFNGRRNIGSSRIRGKWLAKYWPEAEELIQGKPYDAVVYQKAYWVEHARLFKGTKILDLCDRDWTHWGYRVKEMIDEVDAITCSTEALRDAVQHFTSKKVYLVPDRIDLQAHPQRKEHRGNGRAKTVVWFGYSSGFPLLQSSLGALVKYRLNLICIADTPFVLPMTVMRPRRDMYKSDEGYAEAVNGKHFVDLKNYLWSLETVNDDIIRGDIVINPKSEVGRWRYKSNNKTVTAWALGMPVAHGREELERFLDESERVAEAERRIKEVRELYDVRKSVDEMKAVINEVQQAKKN